MGPISRAALLWIFLGVNVLVIHTFHTYLVLSILFLLYRPLHLKFVRFAQRAFVETTVLICFLFHPRSEICVYGDEVLPRENAIFISNHQIYADWLYLWVFFMEYNWHGYLRIMLKHELSHVPIIGWGMRLYEFVFLRRTWAKDKKSLKRYFQRIKDDRCPMALLLFPEGTVICEETIQKNRDYIKKNSLQFESKYVLMPRSTGLEFCVRHLQGNVKYLYDLTVGYSGLSTTEIPMDKYTLSAAFYRLIAPPQIHIYIRRIPMDQIKPMIHDPLDEQDPAQNLSVSEADGAKRPSPETEQSLLKFASDGRKTLNHNSPEFDAWLLKAYKEKDEEMYRFYTTGKFSRDPRWVYTIADWRWTWHLISKDFALLKVYILVAILVYQTLKWWKYI